MRIFDTGVQEVVEEKTGGGILDSASVDQRWVRVKRPTVIAGGELKMSELEVTKSEISKICESPLQLKSN